MDNDLLDNIYFSLPILYGQASEKAQSIGICRKTLMKGLRQLMVEGLVIHPRRGYYLEDLGKSKERLREG